MNPKPSFSARKLFFSTSGYKWNFKMYFRRWVGRWLYFSNAHPQIPKLRQHIRKQSALQVLSFINISEQYFFATNFKWKIALPAPEHIQKALSSSIQVHSSAQTSKTPGLWVLQILSRGNFWELNSFLDTKERTESFNNRTRFFSFFFLLWQKRKVFALFYFYWTCKNKILPSNIMAN